MPPFPIVTARGTAESASPSKPVVLIRSPTCSAWAETRFSNWPERETELFIGRSPESLMIQIGQTTRSGQRHALTLLRRKAEDLPQPIQALAQPPCEIIQPALT